MKETRLDEGQKPTPDITKSTVLSVRQRDEAKRTEYEDGKMRLLEAWK